MRKLTFIPVLFVLLAGCSNNSKVGQSTQRISVANKTADYLQLTSRQNENIIAWWVETDQKSGVKYVYFSRSRNSNLNFNSKNIIPASEGVNAGGEHMPKLVIKADGTYVLVFAIRNKDSNAQFASSVLYSQSFDEGKSWSEPALIHTDTDQDNSHGFPDVILLPDGEVGAIWLDGRHHLDHSVIYFSKTDGKLGFGEDKRIGGPTCQCCKLDMYVDSDKILHLVYRGLSQNNIRDIMHLKSTDNGASFSKPTRISKDNWKIMGCPHNGPSITESDGELYIVWYTQGGEEGLYYAASEDDGDSFTARKKLAESAMHPYVGSIGSTTVAVWDERYKTEENVYRRIKLGHISSEGKIFINYITSVSVEANAPYLSKLTNNESIISWTQTTNNGHELYFQRKSEI
ncbi:glycoside hydrolase [Aliifodinibius sp. S!AR15-10]|uniref:sialidase family protein n=1 Tax=Aliifodinibius sp. S!AR15-10 TaxID=2950437 RepID=UPI00285AFE78|nr:sialidase family protein [Aliifodinibius sp. S!AR15-10]MDR8389987.1 glycoside hydrolase [Aliifodinibius sp. S!AR15-10]